MALFRRIFHRKPPEGLLEISERVFVFDCCFTTTLLEGNEYQIYIGRIVDQFREYFPHASFMVFNFGDGDHQMQISNVLSEYGISVRDYPCEYENCPLLTLEMIQHFLKSSESWLSASQRNVLVMHCQNGAFPVLAFMMAAFLIGRKECIGEKKTLDMMYKLPPQELLQLFPSFYPLPSQLRYLQYVSRMNIGLEGPTLDRVLFLECVVLRVNPNTDGKGCCRPIFRIYGPDPSTTAVGTSNMLFSTPKKSITTVFKQGDCDLVKIDINCHVQGDVVLECITSDDDLEQEEMMFRVMFNTAFVQSNMLILNRDEIDVLWNVKDKFAKDFRVEVLFSEMGSSSSLVGLDVPGIQDKGGLPIEAFAKVQDVLSSLDGGDSKTNNEQLNTVFLQNGIDKRTNSSSTQVNEAKKEMGSLQTVQKENFSSVSCDGVKEDIFLEESPATVVESPKSEGFEFDTSSPPAVLSETQSVSPKSSLDLDCVTKKIKSSELQVSVQRPAQSKIVSPRISQSSLPNPTSYSNSFQGSTLALSRYRAPSVLGITALLHDHAELSNKGICCSLIPESSISASAPCKPNPVQPTNSSDSASLSPEQRPSGMDLINYKSGSKVPPPPPPPPTRVSLSARSLTPQRQIGKPSPLMLISVPAAPAPPPPPSLQTNSYLSATKLPSTPSNNDRRMSDDVGQQLLPPLPPPPPTPFPTSTNSLSSNCNSFSIPPTASLPCSTMISAPSIDLSPTTSSPPLPNPLSEEARPTFMNQSSAPSSPSQILHLSSVPSALPCLPNTLSAYLPPPPPPPPPLPPIGTVKPPLTASLPTLRDTPLASSNVSIVHNPSVTIPPSLTPSPGTSSSSTICQNSSLITAKRLTIPATPPPPPPPQRATTVPSSKCSATPPPCPPSSIQKESPAGSHHVVPPPPAPLSDGLSKAGGTSLRLHSSISTPLDSKGKFQLRAGTRIQVQSKKTSLKPYHWLKLTRAMQGSLWAEAQKSEEASKAPELDMSEIESLFSATVPNSDHGGTSRKTSRRGSGHKPDKVHLIELRRAYNCEIMLTKVKVPLSDLMNSVLALDDSALDIDQVDNLIKFCPTKEEIELLKNYKGDKENLGKCEQFFLELMKVPRVESKLRVFSFKIQFFSQVSDLRSSLNIVNSASEEVRSSVKLKRIMQTILSLGNALNHGTARGSAVGFRLDSLLKLSETRARNNKMTLIHYLCKVLAAKLPEVLDFHEDLVSLEAATKIQLKYLAEEMQAISKGLEKVVQELAASEKDGAVSEHFCKTIKEFFGFAEAEVRSLASLYSGVGRNADALAIYFGEDPARCPFEQVVSTLLNFMRMFRRDHEENCKQLEFEKKKALKEAENVKAKSNASTKDLDNENLMSIVKCSQDV